MGTYLCVDGSMWTSLSYAQPKTMKRASMVLGCLLILLAKQMWAQPTPQLEKVTSNTPLNTSFGALRSIAPD